MRVWARLAVAAALGAGLLARGQAPELRRRRVEAAAGDAVRQVTLDVVVTDAQGKAVEGLKARDLRVLEDGVAQTVLSVVEHGASEPAPVKAGAPLGKNVFSNRPVGLGGSASTVILIDGLDGGAGGQMYLRAELSEYLKTMRAGTGIAIFLLDMRMRTILEMTSNREEAQAALQRLPLEVKVPPALHDRDAPAARKQKIREDYLTEALAELNHSWAAYPGRKNLIWFTGGVPMDLSRGGPDDALPDEIRVEEVGGVRTETLMLNRVAVYPVDARLLPPDAILRSSSGGRGFGGGGGGEVSPGPEANPRHSLDGVAAATGGKAFYEGKKLRSVLGDAVEAGAHFYSVTYRPVKAADGSYRALTVQGAAPGLVTASRQGYYARTAETFAAAREQRASMSPAHLRVLMAAGLLKDAITTSDLVFQVSVRPESLVRHDPAGTQAPAANRLDPGVLRKGYRLAGIDYTVSADRIRFPRNRDGNYEERMELATILYDEEGKQLNGTVSRMADTLSPETYERVLRDGVRLTQTFAVPEKGRYFLRFAVLDVYGTTTGFLQISSDSIQP